MAYYGPIISSMSPKEKSVLAQEHLEVAREDLDDGRMGQALNALFYAAEAAVVALAEVNGVDTKRSHRLKATAARELHEKGVLGQDFSGLLRDLNQGRKDHWYEGEEPDVDLEDAYGEVALLVDAAQEGGA
jgi:HEPN domain-containing protein